LGERLKLLKVGFYQNKNKKMLFTGTTTTALLASVGAVSSSVFDNALPYALVAIGIPLAFYIIKRLISLLPKGR
jgi:hypothetical protein